MIDELGNGPIELDYLLPADQLASGRLQGIFDAAVATLRGHRRELACAHYLTFRNLLPYATVDMRRPRRPRLRADERQQKSCSTAARCGRRRP